MKLNNVYDSSQSVSYAIFSPKVTLFGTSLLWQLDVKAAVSIVVVLVKVLYVLQLVFSSLLSTSPHECPMAITRCGSKQEDPALDKAESSLFIEFSALTWYNGQWYDNKSYYDKFMTGSVVFVNVRVK